MVTCIIFKINQCIHLQFLLFCFLVSEVATKNPLKPTKIFIFLNHYQISKWVKNKIKQRDFMKESRQSIKDLNLRSNHSKSHQGKRKTRRHFPQVMDTREKSQQRQMEERADLISVKPVILSGMISKRSGFLAATSTHTIMVGMAMECYC